MEAGNTDVWNPESDGMFFLFCHFFDLWPLGSAITVLMSPDFTFTYVGVG